MLTADHEREPQPEDVDAGLGDPADVEELRLAEGAVVVMDGHFDDPEPGILDLLHHLEADDTAGLFEIDAFENRPAHQAEVAVDVADRQARTSR